MTPDSSSPHRNRWSFVRELIERVNHPLIPAIIALAVGWALFDGELKERRSDWSAFIVAGDQFIDPDEVPHPISVAEGAGYDGQFFYRLALDPWTPEHHELGGTLDSPAWRHQRILYPLAAWVVSLGTPRHVPEALVLVNLLGIFLIGIAGGVIGRRFGLHAVWGVIPALYPGFLLTLVRDTSEIVAATCLIGGIIFLMVKETSGRWASLSATLMFSLSVLARETTVLFAGAIFLTWAVRHLQRRSTILSWHHGLVPPVVMAVWHFSLYLRWDVFPSAQGGGNVGVPLAGVIGFAREVADRQDRWEAAWLTELWFIAAIVLITLIAIWWSNAAAYVKAAHVLYLWLALMLTRLIWVEDWSFMRALTELHMMAAIIILGSPRWIRIAGVAVWLIFARWMFVEIDVIR